MKSRKEIWDLILSILIVLAWNGRITAQQVTWTEAVTAAVNTLRAEHSDRVSFFTDNSVACVFTLDKNGYTLIYEVCFNSGDRVFLSGCKSCLPVIGHITQPVQIGQERTTLSEDEEIPDGLKMLLHDYSCQIEHCLNQPALSKYNALWDSLQFERSPKSCLSVYIPPLIPTKWGQDKSNDSLSCDHYAYNVLMTNGYQCSRHCAAGCGAVAMAQILKYWSYPSEIPYRCIPYYWSDMPNELIKNNNTQYVLQRHLVSSLLLGCGTDIQTIYCDTTGNSLPCSSSTNIWNVKEGFKSYGYVNSDILYRATNASAWMGILYQELFNNRPVFYAASREIGKGGHAFVCDGYFKDQDNNQYFHFNWGWNGDCDGFFSVDNLNPNYNYPYNHRIIYDIQPTECFQDIIMECDKAFQNVNKSYKCVRRFGSNGYAYIVSDNSSVHLQAGEEILLTNGFYSASGSVFQATIAPCSSAATSFPDYLTDGITENNPADTLLAPKSLQTEVSPADDAGAHAGTTLRIWPNPTDDLLFVELRGAGIADVALYDLQGRVVAGVHAGMFQQTSTATLNMKTVPAGVYVLRMTDTGGREYQRKVVRK